MVCGTRSKSIFWQSVRFEIQCKCEIILVWQQFHNDTLYAYLCIALDLRSKLHQIWLWKNCTNSLMRSSFPLVPPPLPLMLSQNDTQQACMSVSFPNSDMLYHIDEMWLGKTDSLMINTEKIPIVSQSGILNGAKRFNELNVMWIARSGAEVLMTGI